MRFFLPLSPWGNRVPSAEELEGYGSAIGCRLRYVVDPPQVHELTIRDNDGTRVYDYLVEVEAFMPLDTPSPAVSDLVHDGERGFDL